MKGDGTVYLRGKVWWIRYYRDGKPVSVSCGGLTEAQARTKLKKAIRQSDADFIEPSLKRVTIADLIDDLMRDYKVRGPEANYKHSLQRWTDHLKPVFGEMKAHTLGTSQQRVYRAKRADEGAANATINRELQILRRAFKLGYENEPPRVKRVPKFLVTREDNARQGFVDAAQVQALKEAASKEGLAQRTFIELAHWLGWRKGELLNLHVSNIRLFDGGPYGSIRLEAHETKNRKGREIALTPGLRALLEPLVVGRAPAERLFPFATIEKWWVRVKKAANCPDLIFHDMRRSSARAKRSAGVPASVIMSMQGWATDSMFRRYAIVAADDKIDALQRQEDYERRQLQNGLVN
jgi:integrase